MNGHGLGASSPEPHSRLQGGRFSRPGSSVVGRAGFSTGRSAQAGNAIPDYHICSCSPRRPGAAGEWQLPVSEWGNRGGPAGISARASSGGAAGPGGALQGCAPRAPGRQRGSRERGPRPFSLRPDRPGEVVTLTTSISAASGRNDFTTVFYALHVHHKYFHKNMH